MKDAGRREVEMSKRVSVCALVKKGMCKEGIEESGQQSCVTTPSAAFFCTFIIIIIIYYYLNF